MNPPRLAVRLLLSILSDDGCDAALGDLDEEFQEEVVPRLGPTRARLWYWRQALSLATAFALDRPPSRQPDAYRLKSDTMQHDIRDALRTIIRSPSYSVIAIAVLALAIGAASAIFSFVDGVLLRPLPYEHADRIVRLWERPPGTEALRNSISTANFRDWQAQNDAFELLVAVANSPATMTGSGEPRQIRGARVSAGYFEIYGTKPALGRTFAADEDQPGKEHVVVITHRLWRSVFASDPSVVGRTVILDRQPFTIIGVLPADSPFDRDSSDIIRPLAFGPDEQSRNFHWLQAAGLLRPGVTLEAARAKMQPIAARISRDYPDSNKDCGITIERLADINVPSDLRQSLRVLMTAVAMLLLVGCANLANLGLARGTAREREVVVRAALGASRGRIVRQFMLESLLLSGAGGLLGVAIGYAMMRGLQLLLPPLFLPREALVTMDLRALAFALVVSVLTGLIFGTVPALQAGRTDLAGSLKGSSRTLTSDHVRRRLRDAFVVVEVALACMLLVGSGLLMRSFMRLQQVEAARDPETLLTAELTTDYRRFATPDEARVFYRSVLERTASVPGVLDAALSSALPLGGWGYGMGINIAGRPRVETSSREVTFFKIVSPSYFRTIGLSIVRGRALSLGDTAASRRVVVVSQAFVDRFLPNVDPIGQHALIEEIVPGQPKFGPEVPWEIVGVVSNERVARLNVTDSSFSRGVYASIEQSPFYGPSIAIRTTRDTPVTLASLKAAIHAIDPDQPLSEVRTLAAIKVESVASDRLRTWLIGVFGAIAGLLAAIGIYGVISYSVAQRTHEIGVRAALGASRRRLIGLIMRQAALLAIAGLTLGIVGAIASTRLLESLLFGVAPRDAISIAGGAVTLGVAAMIAAWLPARRAAAVDPLVALRAE
jgi:putative ABC transport system permease protein